MGAVQKADSITDLADIIGVPAATLRETFASVDYLAAGQGKDTFGRNFTSKLPLQSPFYAIKVTGSLFHTQGGLVVNADAQVKTTNGDLLPNLFASGGAACGISGPEDWGYLSGNGLLTAVVLGRIAGRRAVREL